MNKAYNLMYWTRDSKIKNLGDYIGELILQKSGLHICEKSSPVYFSVGTILSGYWWKIVEDKKIIWGSGSCGFDFPVISDRDNILAVRGPLTRNWLRLPESTPLGDPALLMPRIYTPVKNSIGPILVANFHSENLKPPPTKLNIIKTISMKVTSDNWFKIIDKICASDFVLANSLHSSVLAFAYEKPWAFYSTKDSKNPLPLRWNDWFFYLGLPQEAHRSVATLEDAIIWWQKYKDQMKRPSLTHLIDCCPWEEVRRVIK